MATRHGSLVRAGDLAVVAEVRRSAEVAREALKGQMAEAAAQVVAEERRAAERRAAERRRAQVVCLRRAGVPERHELVLVAGGFDPARKLSADADAWYRSDRRLLGLGGAVGIGKSLTAAWLLARAPRRAWRNPNGTDSAWPSHLHPRWVRASALARLDTYRAPELVALEACCFLVIDEVGGGDVGAPASFAERLDMLVSGRYDAGLDTVLTSNLTEKEFRDLFGERLYSRMSGDAGVWVERGGKDLRRKEAP